MHDRILNFLAVTPLPSAEEIAEELGADLAEVQNALTHLELEGRVTERQHNAYKLTRAELLRRAA